MRALIGGSGSDWGRVGGERLVQTRAGARNVPGKRKEPAWRGGVDGIASGTESRTGEEQRTTGL